MLASSSAAAAACCLVLALSCHRAVCTELCEEAELVTDEAALLQVTKAARRNTTVPTVALNETKASTAPTVTLNEAKANASASGAVVNPNGSSFSVTVKGDPKLAAIDMGQGEDIQSIIRESGMDTATMMQHVKDYLAGRTNTNTRFGSVLPPALEFKILDRNGDGVISEKDIDVLKRISDQIPFPAVSKIINGVFDKMKSVIEICDTNHNGIVTMEEWIDTNNKMVQMIASMPEAERQQAINEEKTMLAGTVGQIKKASPMFAPLFAETEPSSGSGGGLLSVAKKAGGALKTFATSWGLSNQDAKGIENLFAHGEGTHLDTTALAALVAAAVVEIEDHLLTILQSSHLQTARRTGLQSLLF